MGWAHHPVGWSLLVQSWIYEPVISKFWFQRISRLCFWQSFCILSINGYTTRPGSKVISLINFGSENNICQFIFYLIFFVVVKTAFCLKRFSSSRLFGQKKFWSEKIFGWKNILVEKNFLVEKYFGQKKFLVKKFLGWKNLCVRKLLWF